MPVDRLYFTVATGTLLPILLRSQRVPALGQATSTRSFRNWLRVLHYGIYSEAKGASCGMLSSCQQ